MPTYIVFNLDAILKIVKDLFVLLVIMNTNTFISGKNADTISTSK